MAVTTGGQLRRNVNFATAGKSADPCHASPHTCHTSSLNRKVSTFCFFVFFPPTFCVGTSNVSALAAALQLTAAAFVNGRNDAQFDTSAHKISPSPYKPAYFRSISLEYIL